MTVVGVLVHCSTLSQYFCVSGGFDLVFIGVCVAMIDGSIEVGFRAMKLMNAVLYAFKYDVLAVGESRLARYF